MGIQVELDDFGSGYSSLGILVKLPVDIIKLDINFMREFAVQRPVIETIVDLVHRLGYKAVAEGVETEDQLEVLREIGCDYIQGYYYSSPVPRAGYETYMKHYKKALMLG